MNALDWSGFEKPTVRSLRWSTPSEPAECLIPASFRVEPWVRDMFGEIALSDGRSMNAEFPVAVAYLYEKKFGREAMLEFFREKGIDPQVPEFD